MKLRILYIVRVSVEAPTLKVHVTSDPARSPASTLCCDRKTLVVSKQTLCNHELRSIPRSCDRCYRRLCHNWGTSCCDSKSSSQHMSDRMCVRRASRLSCVCLCCKQGKSQLSVRTVSTVLAITVSCTHPPIISIGSR